MRRMVGAIAFVVALIASPVWAQGGCQTDPFFDPGTYPSWVRPPAVQMAGEAFAANLVPDADGEIKVAAIGMSTAGQMFGNWDQEGTVSPFKFINATLSGAILGHPNTMWETPTATAWTYHLTQGALKNGVADKVQVLIAQTVHYNARNDPDQLLWKQATLDMITAARQVLPNLTMVYLMPMVGTIAQSRMMGEPWNHNQSLAARDIEAEWSDVTLWVGAMSSMWSDRTTANPDGHEWQCSDWQQDLIHYTAAGMLKAGDYFGSKAENESTLAWAFGGEPPPPPPPPPPPTFYRVVVDGVEVCTDCEWSVARDSLVEGAQTQTIDQQ